MHKYLFFCFVLLPSFFSFEIAIKHYHVSTDTQTWNNARTQCQAMAGDLVIINTLEENNLVKSKLPTPPPITYWNGLTRSRVDGIWRWMDGSATSFTDWGSGEPNGAYYPNCGAFYDVTSYLWDDQGCSNNNRYVCEIPGK